MPRLLVTAPGVAGPEDPRLQLLRDAGWEISTHRWAGGRPDEESVVELVQGNDAVIASSTERYTRSVVERADTLKHIARWGVGFESIDVPAATDNGVLVTTTQGSNHWAVADHTFGLMLSLARRIVELDRVARTGRWSRPLGRDVWQKTVGVVGLGRIGKGVAQRASGFEMQVLAYEPYPDRAFCEQWRVELVALDDLFRRSDYVTLHAPGEDDNAQLVDRRRLGLMRPTAVLINTARGVLVDEDALYEALVGGKLAGAGLDVRAQEPPGGDDRFAALDNVVLTPHVAGSTREAHAVGSVMVVESVLQAARGEPPHGLVNAPAWDRRRR